MSGPQKTKGKSKYANIFEVAKSGTAQDIEQLAQGRTLMTEAMKD